MNIASLVISIIGIIISGVGVCISMITLSNTKKTREEVRRRLSLHSLRTECTKRIDALEGVIKSIQKDDLYDLKMFYDALDTITFIWKMQTDINDSLKNELKSASEVLKKSINRVREHKEPYTTDICFILIDVVNSIKKESFFNE